MTVVVGVDGSPVSYAAIRLAREEARLRGTQLVAVMALGGEGVLGTPAGRPLSTPRAPDEDRVLAESTLRSVVKAALGTEDNGVGGPEVQAHVEPGQMTRAKRAWSRRPCMQAQAHPLEPFFQQMVRNSYAGKLGMHDTAITSYVARLLCEFGDPAVDDAAVAHAASE